MVDNKKENCWEFFDRGCEVEGVSSKNPGTCSVPFLQEYDGKNNGKNAGRCCWQVMKDLGNVKGMGFLKKKFFGECMQCKFFKKVREEEGGAFKFFD
jgi:hypothetical protein